MPTEPKTTSFAPPPTVIRPSASAFAARAVIGLGVAWPLLLLRVDVATHQMGPAQTALLFAGTITALILVAAVYFLNVRVVVTDDVVTVRGMTGRERRWPRNTIEGCVLVSVLLAIRPTKLIIVQGRDRQVLFSVTADMWDERALRRLTHALGYQHHATSVFKTMDRDAVMADYPGALSFVNRHAWAVGAVAGGGLALLAITVGVAVQSLLGT